MGGDSQHLSLTTTVRTISDKFRRGGPWATNRSMFSYNLMLCVGLFARDTGLVVSRPFRLADSNQLLTARLDK